MSTPNTTLGNTIINRLAQATQKFHEYNPTITRIAATLQGLPGKRARDQGTELSDAQSGLNGADPRNGYEETLKSIARQVNNLDQQLVSTKAEKRALQQERTTLQTERNEAHQRSARLQRENDRLRSHAGSGNADDIDRLNDRISDLENEKRRLRRENERLRNQQTQRPWTPDNSRRILELEQEVEILKAEKTTLRTDKAALEREKVDLNARMLELEREVGLARRCNDCRRRRDHRCRIRQADVRFP